MTSIPTCISPAHHLTSTDHTARGKRIQIPSRRWTLQSPLLPFVLFLGLLCSSSCSKNQAFVQAFPIFASPSTTCISARRILVPVRESTSRTRLYGADDEDLADSKDDAVAGNERGLGLNAKIEQQQKQIELLMSLVKKQQQQQEQLQSKTTESPATSRRHVAATAAMTPLKAMMFIDGTWLYYTIHERSEVHCPIIKRHGRGWQNRYYFDWPALPRVVSQALQNQGPGWAVQARPIDIARASVFTSYKADTSPNSLRFKMYQEMAEANYDIHMMETVGKSEKCVDINIAVEMLHYATVPNAYDVAILLTGDKDFIPAMRRTRQKGRKVALVSMSKRGCNPALYEDDGDAATLGNIRDYDVVWLEDYLDELIKPKDGADLEAEANVSTFTFMKVVSDFITASGFPRVNSRDVGKYLKDLRINDETGSESCILEVLKYKFGGLYQFLSISRIFNCVQPSIHGRNDKAYWVELKSDADVVLVEEARRARFSSEEKAFFDQYSLKALEDKEVAYPFTLERMFPGRPRPSSAASDSSSLVSPSVPLSSLGYQSAGMSTSSSTSSMRTDDSAFEEEDLDIPEELSRNYGEMKVAELKYFCREHGLKVSGTKVELLERIKEYVDGRLGMLEQAHKERWKGATKATAPVGDNDKTADEYLTALISEYIHAAGGRASSRDIGRYLAANKASEERLAESFGVVRVSALNELKEEFKTLANFVFLKPDLFQRVDGDRTLQAEEGGNYAFYVEQRQPGTNRETTIRQTQQQL